MSWWNKNEPYTFYLYTTAFVAVVAMVVVPLSGLPGSRDTFWRAFGLAIVVGLAAFEAVGIIGFLFGVPPARLDGRDNQSLQQISDWLTKIIIGASLVALRDIARFVGDLGESIGTSSGLPAGPQLYAALIVTDAACGFVFFYFWACMYWPIFRKQQDEASERTPKSERPTADW